jgi:small nuclear ribonucleoprotein (snRNP)-like protein
MGKRIVVLNSLGSAFEGVLKEYDELSMTAHLRNVIKTTERGERVIREFVVVRGNSVYSIRLQEQMGHPELPRTMMNSLSTLSPHSVVAMTSWRWTVMLSSSYSSRKCRSRTRISPTT